MFAWIKKLFQNHEESENEFGNREAKIRDIRRRIEEQKQAIGYHSTQPSVDVDTREILAGPPPVNTVQENKNAELDDIKAKLLRKKSPPTK
jgi:hypothetical protein